ncbi:MAG: extracellular solute-binding protein, partial [Spirochaetales bacterium]|nr:extracellular solute-binding protein [Spirochaetales bacterium]
MKKILCTLVILVMLSGLAIAAGNDEGTSGDALNDVTISWYYPGNYPQNDQDTVFDEFNRLLKEKINTTIDFKTIAWGDYNQKMQVIIAAGEEYDLCYTANWINNYHHNVAKGAFVPLDDLLTEYAPGLWASVPE